MRALGVSLALVLALALGCERSAKDDGERAAAVELDAGALRASAIEGLEAAADDPQVVAELGLAAALEQAAVQPAIERLLARLGMDRELSDASDRLFADVQDGPGIRAALAEYARANPELDLTALTEGFVAHVDERLTRPAIAAAIEATLRSELRSVDPALARALLVEAGAAERMAVAILITFADANVRAELEARLGKDPATLQDRLSKRLAEPRRVGELVARLGDPLGDERGISAVAAIVDHEQTATLLAAALARVLDDVDVRERCELLFGLALAEELDTRAFERELRAVLDEPIVVREASALVGAVASEPWARELVAGLVDEAVEGPAFSAAVIDALD